MTIRIVALLALVCFAASVEAKTLKPHAVAHMIGLEGQTLGQVDFTQTPHGVLVEFDLHGLTPGEHAAHIHGSGACVQAKHFTTAGPHLMLEPRAHGYLAKGGPHEGDLPNQFAGANGALHATVLSNAFSLGNGAKSLFDRDGAAIVLHAGADDYLSQPAGNSGDRIACGVIERTIAPGTRNPDARSMHE